MRTAAVVVAGAALSWSIFEQGLAYYNITQQLNAKETRDESRGGYKSFGLNYGYKTDRSVRATQIEEILDTGDLLFVQADCWRLNAEPQIRRCFARKAVRFAKKYVGKGYAKDEGWDAVALLYRDEDGAMVAFNTFGFKNVFSYNAFLALPYISAVALRKLSTKDEKSGQVTKRFLGRAMGTAPDSLTEMIDGVDIVKMYLAKTGLGTDEALETVEDVEKAVLVKPDLGKYGAKIIVRTEDSRAEVANY